MSTTTAREEQILADMIEAADATATSNAGASYARWGDDRPAGQWAMVVGHSRDSDSLEESNYCVIYADLRHRFGDSDLLEERDNHWAFGWVEHVYARVGTPACGAALAWRVALDAYPVADEEEYSAREWEDDHPSGDSYCYSESCASNGEFAEGRELA